MGRRSSSGGEDVNKGKGIFTEFVKQVVGNNKFYVRVVGAAERKLAKAFWYKTFNCVNIGGYITSCIDRSTVRGQPEISGGSSGLSEGGGRRKKTRRRKYKSKKRRKSKCKKSKRKPKRRCRSSRTRRGSR